jgi:hypothetical protein
MNNFKPVLAETETNRGQKLIAPRFHSYGFIPIPRRQKLIAETETNRVPVSSLIASRFHSPHSPETETNRGDRN